jgi:putative ABC transport system permease protein
VAIIYASQAFIASKNYLVRQEFDQRLGYDCQLFLSQEPDAQTLEQIGALGYVRDLQRVGFYSCPIAHDGRSCDATVNAVAPDSDLIGIYDARGERIAVPTHGIVLDEHLAQELGVGVGDTVELRGARLRVEALSRQDSNRVQYVSLETMRDLGEGSIGCVICRVDPTDQQRLMQALSERDDYVFAIFTDVLRSSTERLHATYDTSAWILTSFAVAIGALVVFNVTQANLLERKRELCVLRTLGFEHRQLSAALLWQTLLYAGLACVLGLPAGTLLALRALGLISTPDRSFPYANGPLELTVTVGIVLLYAVASHFLAMRSMRRWDINEGVKDRE